MRNRHRPARAITRRHELIAVCAGNNTLSSRLQRIKHLRPELLNRGTISAPAIFDRVIAHMRAPPALAATAINADSLTEGSESERPTRRIAAIAGSLLPKFEARAH